MVEELNFPFYWRGYVSIETLVLRREGNLVLSTELIS